MPTNTPMNYTLFFDTETTGIPVYGSPSHHVSQPHIVEIAAILVDEHWNIVESLHHIVKPFGWKIPEGVSRIHGITNAVAEERGVMEEVALREFFGLLGRASLRVAYNDAFDARMIRIACKRYAPELAEWWKDFPSACAMRLTQDLLGGKLQTLANAHQAVLGKVPADQHTAMGDTKAVMSLFRALADPSFKGKRQVVTQPARAIGKTKGKAISFFGR